MRGHPKTLKLSSAGQVPCTTGFLHSGVLGSYLDQCASWWCCERLHSASVNFCWRLHAVAHFMVGDLWVHLPTLHWVFSSIWQKNWHDPHAPPSLFTWSHPRATFFVSLDEKSPQKDMFWRGGRGEIKSGKSTKRHQNWQVQKLFWAVERMCW